MDRKSTIDGRRKMRVLISHPHVGSVWLTDAYYTTGDDGREYVVGDTWDDGDIGSPMLPDDYSGQPVTMNFLATCVKEEWPRINIHRVRGRQKGRP